MKIGACTRLKGMLGCQVKTFSELARVRESISDMHERQDSQTAALHSIAKTVVLMANQCQPSCGLSKGAPSIHMCTQIHVHELAFAHFPTVPTAIIHTTPATKLLIPTIQPPPFPQDSINSQCYISHDFPNPPCTYVCQSFPQ